MTTLADNLAAAAAIARPALAIIDGRACPSASGETFADIGPRDGQVLADIASGGAADIDRAVAAARRSFEAGIWRDLAPRARKSVLLRLAELLEREAGPLALLESLDTGKPIADARAVDIPLAIGTARWYAEAIDKIYGEVAPSPTNRLSYAVWEPLGVVGAIVPWNFPLHMAMWKVAPALAAGNSVVLKPSELSPMTALRLGALALEAGVPPGVLNVVPGFGATAGDALARHMDVDALAFTGSGRTGRALLVAAGQSNGKRVSLELGGKSPQIVFADAPDLDAAAEAAAWGVFFNAGQVCTAASRLLVERSIHESFMARVDAVARTIAVGDPLDPATRLGAIASARQLDGVLAHVARAEEEGGRRRLGGARVRAETGGFFVEPTIFDVAPDATLAREEVFGPVLGAIAFEDAGDAFRIANDTPYGLAAGVWTGAIGTAMAATRRLRAGLVWVNGWDACDIASPFGGFKQSGHGRDRSLHALRNYADLKSVSISF